MDNTDKLILAELSRNSRISMKELGEKVHLTGQAVASRVAKLEDNGVIKGYTINVNQFKLGVLCTLLLRYILILLIISRFLLLLKRKSSTC